MRYELTGNYTSFYLGILSRKTLMHYLASNSFRIQVLKSLEKFFSHVISVHFPFGIQTFDRDKKNKFQKKQKPLVTSAW